MSASKQSVLMTEGPISRQLLAFALPVFLGQLFQQLYNTADTLIVGQLLDSYALAAVSSSGNLIMLLVGFFNGMAMGASIVVSQTFGGERWDDVRKTVHTITALGVIISVVLALLGSWLSPILLVWMDTPADVLPLSNEYFSIYFAGIAGLVMYNIFSSIMRAVGDSKTPLYFLIFSSVLNVILDLLFMGPMHMGVGGAALATVIAQMLSAILAMFTLMRAKDVYRLELRKVRIHKRALYDVVRNGLPAGVQNSIISFANTIVQSQINHFGYTAMAGIGAYSKLEGFAFLPIQSFGMAASTFIAQNIGAHKLKRARTGANCTILWSVLMAELMGVIFVMFAPTMIGWFDSNPEVVAYGVGRARIDGLFYFLLAYSHAVSAVCRGGGKPAVPMYVMMIVWCGIRVAFLEITAPFENINFVYWVYPLTWFISSVYFFWYDRTNRWMKGHDDVEQIDDSRPNGGHGARASLRNRVKEKLAGAKA